MMVPGERRAGSGEVKLGPSLPQQNCLWQVRYSSGPWEKFHPESPQKWDAV